MIRKMAVFFFLAAFLAACTSENKPQEKAKGCLENKPHSISGLKVTGARSEKNVIHNLWPLVCRAQELYGQRLKENPGLKKGMVELKLSVEFNGEIGPFSLIRNTVGDPVFEKRLLKLFQFMDFDPYGEHNSQSEIILPIHFKP
jgi:hypothetical protein